MRNFYRLTFSFLTGFFIVGCDYSRPGDYDPQADYRAFLERKEEEVRLRAAGPAPTADPAAEFLVEAKRLYALYCAACHGPDGLANTPTALAMRPAPRAFNDQRWHASVDDAHITTVIRDGGTAVGLSATMTPWGAVLSAEQIDGLVNLVREFGK